MKQQKNKKLNVGKNKKALKSVWHDLHSDISYLQYIITSQESDEIKQDMLFSLFNCLSDRTKALSKIVWE